MEKETKEKLKLKDNAVFRTIIITLALLFIFCFRFIPAPTGLSQYGMAILGIFLGCLLLWLTISIDWPSLLCILAIGLVYLEMQVSGVSTSVNFTTALSSAFGNDTFIFLLFTFICTYALSKTPIIKRIALAFINNKFAKKGPWHFIILYFASVMFLGLFMSPSVLFFVLLPILQEILVLAKVEKGEKLGNMLIMGLAFTVSLSSGMTPIAHIFPILAMSSAGVSVSYATYMFIAIPVGLLCFAGMILMFKYILKPNVNKLKNVDITPIKETLPKTSKEEIASLIIFGFVIALWLIIDILKSCSNDLYLILKNFGSAIPPIIGTLLLCIIRFNKKPLLSLPDAFKNGVPWSGMIMCAGTLCLGSAMTNASIGLKTFLQTSFASSLSGVPAIILIILFITWAALQTNVSSNMVTAQVVAGVVASVVGGMGGINLLAMVVLIGMMASFAFATPPSMPHIAITAGSDWSNTKSVLQYGGLLMIISIIIAIAVGYPLGLWLL